MFNIGPHKITSQAVLAPMAGITDLPFRNICRDKGAGLATGEMLTSDTKLWNSNKSKTRIDIEHEAHIKAIQIAGGEAQQMAEAAQKAEQLGADIIDINMGCPVKKVCSKAAGSALLKDEALVEEIIKAVVTAVKVPVSLKIRTGWSPELKNGVTIAKIAEQNGIQSLAVHGRTRECRFKGPVEYETIAKIVDSVSIPVVANGNIDSPEQAQTVLDLTGATAVMVGRAAQGNPWIFEQINAYLAGKNWAPVIELYDYSSTITKHLISLYEHYGEYLGIRIARKHITWYLANRMINVRKENKPHQELQLTQLRKVCNTVETAKEQLTALQLYFEGLHQIEDQVA